MKQEDGAWITLDELPSEIATKGLPRAGDIVRLTYRGLNPASGSAKRVTRPNEKISTTFAAKEDGASFSMSGNFTNSI